MSEKKSKNPVTKHSASTWGRYRMFVGGNWSSNLKKDDPEWDRGLVVTDGLLPANWQHHLGLRIARTVKKTERK